MTRAIVCLLGLLALTGCGDQSAKVDETIAQALPAVKGHPVLPDSDGNPCKPLAADGRKATVILFLMHDCPVANASAPEIERQVKGFSQKGIRFYGIYATETAAEIN